VARTISSVLLPFDFVAAACLPAGQAGDVDFASVQVPAGDFSRAKIMCCGEKRRKTTD
jgi:hypothetical protein